MTAHAQVSQPGRDVLLPASVGGCDGEPERTVGAEASKATRYQRPTPTCETLRVKPALIFITKETD
jgi:hypothetical protein